MIDLCHGIAVLHGMFVGAFLFENFASQQSSDVVKAAPVPLTFPQFLPYVRAPELELWRLTAADAAHD